MTPDVARLRKLIACMRELADRLADEVESVERAERRVQNFAQERPTLRVVR